MTIPLRPKGPRGKNDENTVSDPKEVAESFNDYFSTIASTIGFDDEILTPISSTFEKHAAHPSINKMITPLATVPKTLLR